MERGVLHELESGVAYLEGGRGTTPAVKEEALDVEHLLLPGPMMTRTMPTI